MDRVILAVSTFCFLFGFAYTMYALGARVYRSAGVNFWIMIAGFALQTWFLRLRGQEVGRCPLTNLFEVLVFLSWAVVLLYFIIGPTYRLSLLGTFTAPLVFFILLLAQLLPQAAQPEESKVAVGYWMELHAAISLMAYGAFALGGVAGVMLLVQERLLKRHQMNSFFRNLPPIADLAVAMEQVIFAGFILLTAGLLAGFMAGSLDAHRDTLPWMGLWLLYGVLLILRRTHRVSARRIAWLAIGSFVVALITLWGLRL